MKIDEQTFVELYDEFAPKIFKYCYFRVNSREDAEDITAQTFTRAWDYILEGKVVESAQAFLFQIAHNLVIDYYRKGRSSREVSLDDENRPIDIADETDYETEVDVKLAIAQVRETMQELPDNYREVISLRYINDLSIKEIAQTMSITENNASVLLHRATEKLKLKINK